MGGACLKSASLIGSRSGINQDRRNFTGSELTETPEETDSRPGQRGGRPPLTDGSQLRTHFHVNAPQPELNEGKTLRAEVLSEVQHGCESERNVQDRGGGGQPVREDRAASRVRQGLLPGGETPQTQGGSRERITGKSQLTVV